MDRVKGLWRYTLVRNTVGAAIAVGLLLAVILSVSDYRNTQIAPIAYTACAAVGLTLLVGLSGQISLGNGAFMMIGAYTLALILKNWNTSHPNLALVGILAACVVTAAISGAVVGVAAARLRGPYLAGATLALAVGLPSLASYEHLQNQLGGNHGVSVTPPLQPAGYSFYQWQSVLCCVGAVVVFWLIANIKRSRVGRSMRAVRDDEIAAALAGLSVARVQVLAFVVSAGCAGLAGGLLALINLNAGPNAFGLSVSLTLLAAVVIGGLGTLSGAALGSLLVVMLSNYWAQDIASALSIHSGKVSNNLPLMLYGVLLAVVMLVAPGGIVGLLRQGTGVVRRRLGRR